MEKGIKKTYGRPLLKEMVDVLNRSIVGGGDWGFVIDVNGKYRVINHARKFGMETEPMSAKEASMFFLGLTEGLVNHVRANANVNAVPSSDPMSDDALMTSKNVKVRLENDPCLFSTLIFGIMENRVLKIAGGHRFLFDRCYKMLKAGHSLQEKDKARIINLLTSYYYKDMKKGVEFVYARK